MTSGSNVLCRLDDGHRLHPRGQEGPEEQYRRAEELCRGEPFVKDPGGKRERTERAEQLQGLRERDADLSDGKIVKNMRQGDAEHGRSDQNPVHLCVDVQRRVNFAKRPGKRKKHDGGRKLMTPKLRMAPSRAEGFFTSTP